MEALAADGHKCQIRVQMLTCPQFLLLARIGTGVSSERLWLGAESFAIPKCLSVAGSIAPASYMFSAVMFASTRLTRRLGQDGVFSAHEHACTLFHPVLCCVGVTRIATHVLAFFHRGTPLVAQESGSPRIHRVRCRTARWSCAKYEAVRRVRSCVCVCVCVSVSVSVSVLRSCGGLGLLFNPLCASGMPRTQPIYMLFKQGKAGSGSEITWQFLPTPPASAHVQTK